MNELLQQNQVVNSHSGRPAKVLKFIGAGGQGEVYRIEWCGAEYALKWYYEQSATQDQRTALDALIAGGSPSEKFLWPLDLAEAKGVPGFGYIMRLREPHYRGLNDLMSGRIRPDPISLVLISAGIDLAKAFRSLHTKGLSYRDISFGNAFFDPGTGEVLVCDNDNVATNRTAKASVFGTPDFMAPEIVRMEAVPSRATDFHSLAVLLFYIFHLGHPLVGKKVLSIRCWDGAARELVFGREPLFIFDPTNNSNAAVDKSLDPTGETGGTAKVYWDIYPQAFRNTFIKAFTLGLGDPDSRVTDLEWLEALSVLRDSLFRCACGKSNYYDVETTKAASGQPRPCWSCKQVPRIPFRIRIGKAIVLLNSDSRLYPHHTGDGKEYDFSKPVAEVVRHPTDPKLWGLKNLGAQKWVATMPDGGLKDVEPGRSAPLATNVKINFGRAEGEVRY